MWDSTQLDRAIDAVAREMTAAQPRDDMRMAVMARIERRGGRYRSIATRAFAAALAAAAIVAAATVAYRQFEASVPPNLPTAPPVQVATQLPPTPSFETPRTGASRARSQRSPRRAALPTEIDALAPAPLLVAPLTVDSLDAPPLDVVPLDPLAPIALAPLAGGDRP